MKKNKSILQGLFATLVLIFLFICHSYLNKINQWVSAEFLIKSYFVLLVLTSMFFVLFGIAKIKFRDHLGFLYLFWVLIKFVILFFLFYTEINNDSISKKMEAISLLIPYLITIFLSAFPLSRELNRQ